MPARGVGRTVGLLGLAVSLVAASARPARAEYRSLEVEALRLTIDSDWGSRTAPGYLPVRFDITNLGEARVIEIGAHGVRFIRAGRGSGQATYTVRQQVRLSRGDRVRFTMPIPIYADNENVRFELREDGRVLERFNYTGFQSRVRPDDASALIVVEPGSAFAKAAAGWLRTLAGPSGGRGGVVPVPPGGSVTMSMPARVLDFVLPPDRLPSNWLGYTSLRAVILGSAEWAKLADEQKQALLTWTACGGDLFFVDGRLDELLPGDAAAAASPDRPVRAYLLGRIHLPSSAAVESAGLADVLVKAAALQDANWSLPANRASDWGAIAERGFRLPIPGVRAVPARAYLLILILFSLLIGPANYWFLWRRRQQVLLVLTAPLISLLFIVLLAGYVVAGEGVGVRGRAVTFTMLDQARRHAATRASVSLYAAGMAPIGGLGFARDEAVYTIGVDGQGSRDAQMLDLTETQRFTSGAIQARSPANLETIAFRAARERLVLEADGSAIAIVNGLGATIRALVYRTGGAVHHLPAPLPAGQKAVLSPGAPRAAIVPPALPQSPRLEHLFANTPDGAYLAVLDRSPFWNAGVASIDERESFHVVVGWVGGQP